MPSGPMRTLPVELHGNGSAAYAIVPFEFSESSVVYSVGVGSEISFELSVSNQYGPRIEAFDPTDQSEAFIRRSALPDTFSFHKVAIGSKSGVETFREVKPSTPSYMAGALGLREGRGVNVSVLSLLDAMQLCGDRRIDVLKLDIEGGEFEVLQSILEHELDVRQIALEFHPHIANLRHHQSLQGRYGWLLCAEWCQRLADMGYELVYVSPRGTEHTWARACRR